MKRFYAERLLRIFNLTGLLDQLCHALGADHRASDLVRDQGTFADLKQFEEDCRELGLLVAANETRRLILGIESHDLTADQLSEQAHCVLKVLESELGANRFLAVKPGYGERLEPLPHFGEAVARVFPKAAPDISEAAACLALERYPACVFHSMLVLEHGLRWMCRALSLKFPPYGQWGEVIQNIETAIGKLNPPKTKVEQRRRRDFLAAAAAHLHVVKDGWRNHVMHGRSSNGPEASEAVYESVRRFMKDLAEHSERRRRRRP